VAALGTGPGRRARTHVEPDAAVLTGREHPRCAARHAGVPRGVADRLMRLTVRARDLGHAVTIAVASTTLGRRGNREGRRGVLGLNEENHGRERHPAVPRRVLPPAGRGGGARRRRPRDRGGRCAGGHRARVGTQRPRRPDRRPRTVGRHGRDEPRRFRWIRRPCRRNSSAA
jgi:hypothetical protein